MPPKTKRNRTSAASTPLRETQPKTPVDTTAGSPSKEQLAEQVVQKYVNDPWTNEEETALLKSMMYTKPTGMHKHFRMIGISNSLRSHGHVRPHTRIPGIWTKLDEFFDLLTLDERECAIDPLTSNCSPFPSDRSEMYDCPSFELSEEEFGDLMWEARFPKTEEERQEASPNGSPVLHPDLLSSPDAPPPLGLPSSPSGLDIEGMDLEDSAEPSPQLKGKGGKPTKSAVSRARSMRSGKGSKTQSTVSESEEEASEEEDESSSSEEKRSTKDTKRGKTAARARGSARRPTRKR